MKNIAKIISSSIAMILGWALGGYLGAVLFHSNLVNRMETLSGKCGASLGVLIAVILIERFLLKSVKLMLVSLALVELSALLLISHYTGFNTFPRFGIPLSVIWLYTLTWNVVLVSLFGTLLSRKSRA